MNEMINKILLAWNRLMPEIHLRKSNLNITLADHLLQTNREYKNLKKEEIQDIFTKTN